MCIWGTKHRNWHNLTLTQVEEVVQDSLEECWCHLTSTLSSLVVGAGVESFSKVGKLG